MRYWGAGVVDIRAWGTKHDTRLQEFFDFMGRINKGPAIAVFASEAYCDRIVSREFTSNVC